MRGAEKMQPTTCDIVFTLYGDLAAFSAVIIVLLDTAKPSRAAANPNALEKVFKTIILGYFSTSWCAF